MEGQRTRIAKTVLEKDKVARITLLKFKIKATVIKIVWSW